MEVNRGKVSSPLNLLDLKMFQRNGLTVYLTSVPKDWVPDQKTTNRIFVAVRFPKRKTFSYDPSLPKMSGL